MTDDQTPANDPTAGDAPDAEHLAAEIAEWRDKALRIGHMGLGRQPDHVITLLLAMEETLRYLGWQVAQGGSLVGLSELWEG